MDDMDREERAFEADIRWLAVWAQLEAARSGGMAWEWVAAGVGLVAAYLITVVAPRGDVTLVDVFVLVLAVGGTVAMLRFELASETALEEFVRNLRDLPPSTGVPRSEPPQVMGV